MTIHAAKMTAATAKSANALLDGDEPHTVHCRGPLSMDINTQTGIHKPRAYNATGEFK